MTRVSKVPLKEKVYKDILETFWGVIINLDDEAVTEEFLNVFLSSAEKTMLAKRLAIAVMLEVGVDYKSISDALKVSTATIRDVGYKLGNPKFKEFIRRFADRFKEEKREMSWLEAFLGAKTNMKARAKLLGGRPLQSIDKLKCRVIL
ncbi:MAG: hypothetical protein A2172_02185 [Candidatus Woykebacteria bacterium RBG_13_40_15]|uniref:TrpR like protein, YerC/YecD n=1 Tax=Candidatus Woykebacteria bacterium RBG_13_40_15 TaxID=1802593 RepID=A0A1G1W652_9BACT|nr:MAG: hypothetical protein A2172_02185 [Candidatus Woykebacteria bacterium RBG_13_40_15]